MLVLIAFGQRFVHNLSIIKYLRIKLVVFRLLLVVSVGDGHKGKEGEDGLK